MIQIRPYINATAADDDIATLIRCTAMMTLRTRHEIYDYLAPRTITRLLPKSRALLSSRGQSITRQGPPLVSCDDDEYFGSLMRRRHANVSASGFFLCRRSVFLTPTASFHGPFRHFSLHGQLIISPP